MPRLSACLLVTAAVSVACGSDKDLFGRRNEPSTTPVAQVEPESPATPASTALDGKRTVASVIEQEDGNSYLVNQQALIESLGLGAYHRLGKHGKKVKVAVLDNGFSGLKYSLGKRLPPDTELVKSALDQMDSTTHGTKLAEIVYALATGKSRYDEDIDGPEIILMNTYGFSNFKQAVDEVIKRKIDIVLYAQVWQYFGNFDGRGFINTEVNRATKAGVLWINAAGNMGRSTYNSAVNINADGVSVTLPHEGRFVRFTVPKDQTRVAIALSWNDNRDTSNFATDQDLDLVLEDAYHNQLGVGRLRQSGPAGNKSDPLYSAYPRETVTTMVNAGTYLLRVEAISRNFKGASQLRLSIDGEGIVVLDTPSDNSVGIPADNATVLTVGASDVDYSGKMPAAAGTKAKPELQVISSEVKFSDGETHRGTSAASAIVAAGMAVFQGTYGKQSRAQVIDLMARGILATPATRQATTPSFKLGAPR
ncbi:MAG: protease [Deltaproteobacteria bacterium]|nr:protease [Deltaproteobacteria bacterium]